MQLRFLCQKGSLCWRPDKRKFLQGDLFGVCWLVYWNVFLFQNVSMISNEMYCINLMRLEWQVTIT